MFLLILQVAHDKGVSRYSAPSPSLCRMVSNTVSFGYPIRLCRRSALGIVALITPPCVGIFIFRTVPASSSVGVWSTMIFAKNVRGVSPRIIAGFWFLCPFFKFGGFAHDCTNFSLPCYYHEEYLPLSLDAIMMSKLCRSHFLPVFVSIPWITPVAVAYLIPLDAVSIGNGLSSGTTPPVH